MLSLNLTPRLSFEPRFRMFIINGYDRKSKRLQSLDFLFFSFSLLTNRNKNVNLKIELWHLFTEDQKVIRQCAGNSFALFSGHYKMLFLSVARNVHKLASFLCSLHNFGKFIVVIVFIVRYMIWFT